MNLFLEITAVTLSLIYLALLMKENIACWFFGITASFISIYLFYSIGLYSEALLYIYYVIIGVYGYWLWNKTRENETLAVTTVTLENHVLIVFVGIILSFTLGYIFDNNTDAVNPYLDSTTTIFSFIASLLEAKKILSSWTFWLFINAATFVLYVQQELTYYLFLTIVYFIFSGIGFAKWRRSYRLAKTQ
jgi:nicotinamide mononucleotide transporter